LKNRDFEVAILAQRGGQVSITSTGASKLGRQLAYRVNDAAAVSGLCRSTLYNLMRAGKLDYVDVGKIRMIRASDLHRLLQLEEPAD
jgi:excisionase family DNA binding protein